MRAKHYMIVAALVAACSLFNQDSPYQTCACDNTCGCEASCECDPDCGLACDCDDDNGCSAHCPCDPECRTPQDPPCPCDCDDSKKCDGNKLEQPDGFLKSYQTACLCDEDCR